MKKFIVPVLSVCFFISCNTDDTSLNTVASTTDSASDEKITKKTLTTAANPDNEFDYVGQVHTEILDTYLENYERVAIVTDVIADVKTVALNNAVFASISVGYTGVTPATVNWTVANINYPVTIIDKAGLSTRGKASLTELVNMLDMFEYQSPDVACNIIKDFEEGVISDAYLTAKDARVILSTSSIARYSVTYGGIKKRWWKNIRSGIVGSINSASVPESLMVSITSDLLSNDL